MSLRLYRSEPRVLAELSADPTLQEAVPMLAQLARDRAFLDSYILPLLEEPERSKDWHMGYCCDGKNGSYSLQIFVWPPSSKTKIHDHSCLGAFCCVIGSLSEERYERLGGYDRQSNRARLRKVWQRLWKREDGISTLLPFEGGIHRVRNPTESKAISVHLYGPQIGDVDGRDYDPSHDYVCDRRETR